MHIFYHMTIAGSCQYFLLQNRFFFLLNYLCFFAIIKIKENYYVSGKSLYTEVLQMEMWTALGIEKTKDIEAITNAYHEKLALVHPEERPEEFMALRSEYEEALKYASSADEQEGEKEKTPVDLWMDKVTDVYNHFKRRVNADEWHQLFSDDVCQSVDSRIDARNALLRFCMDNDALPREIWQLIDKEFSITENVEALYEIFPKAYIDNAVLPGINNDPYIPYDLFDNGTEGNPDCYFNLYFKARNEIQNGELDNARATIDDIEKTGIKHPFTDILRGRIEIKSDNNDKALEILDAAAEKCPENPAIRANRADSLSIAGRYEEALSDYEFAKSKGYLGARYNHADCLMKLERYVEAKDLILELVTEYPFEENFRKFFDTACAKAKEQYSKNYDAGTLDYEALYEYAWLCFQSDENERTEEIIAKLNPETIEQKCDLLNLKSKLYSNKNDSENSLQSAIEWEKAVAELPEGETEKEKNRKNKLDDIYYIQAIALAQLEKFDEALEKAAASIDAGPKRRSNAHDLRRSIFRSKKRDIDSALREAEKMVEANPSSWTYYILGTEQYEQNMLQDAYNSFGESLEYTLELSVYIYRIRILCDAEEWDGAEEQIKYLEEHNIDCDALNYCKARVLEGKGETDAALNIYNSIIANFEKNASDINFVYEVYFRAAELQEKTMPNDNLLTLIDKGLAVRPDYYPLLYFKTTVLENMEKPAEAIEVYRRIEELYPGKYTFSVGYANNYYDLYNYEKAAEHYLNRLENFESPGLHDMAGLCLMYLKRYDEAEEHFTKAVEMEPENVRFRTNLASLFEYKFDFEKACGIHKESSEINDRKEESERRLFVNRCYARALSRAGRYEESAELYRKNLEMFGRNDDARFVIEVYIEAAMLDKAVEHIIKYKSEDKINENQYHLMMADVRRMQGDHKEYFRQISSVSDDNSYKHSRIGRYYLHQGKYKKALPFFEKMDEDAYDLYNDYLFCLRKMGKTDECEKIMEKGLESINKRKWGGDEKALYLTKLALVYTAAGHPEKAKAYIDEVLESTPLCDHCRYSKCKDAYLALAEYYEQMGDYNKVIEICNEGLEIAKDEYDFVYISERVRKEHKKELKKENRK